MPPMEAFVDGDTDANLRGFQNNSHKCILFGKLKVCLSFQTGVATAGVWSGYEESGGRGAMHWKLPQGVAWCKEDYDKRGPIN